MTNIPIAIAIAVLLFIPAAAWTACLPACLNRRAMIGPLLGVASTAWIIELAYYLGLPVEKTAVASIAVFGGVIALRRDTLVAGYRDLCRASALYLCCFIGSLFAVSLTAWPAAGPWSNDWAENLFQLDSLWSGTPLSGWMLARPPLFAASAVPFRLVLDALPALQVAACLFAAAALVALLWVAEKFSEREELSESFLLLVGLSVFYLVNLTAIVPKFIQGVLIVSAFVVLKNPSRPQLTARIAISAFLIGLAIEVHHSTAAYAIAYAALLWHAAEHRVPHFVRALVLCIPVILVVVVIPELLRIARFGLDQIIHFNPSTAMRSSQPAWLLWLLNIESIFVGWAYLLPVWNIIKVAHDASWQTIGYYANWFLLVHLGMMSDTLLLIFAPFVFTWKRLRTALSFVSAQLPLDIALGIATVPPILAWLMPYLIAQGQVHAGATALAVGGLALGMAWLASAPAYWRGSLLVTVTAGTVWWVIWNAFQYITVLQAGGIAQSGPGLESDGDWSLVVARHELPWGYGYFPWMPLVLACLTAVCFIIVTSLARKAMVFDVHARATPTS
jgi:hypothetical protein